MFCTKCGCKIPSGKTRCPECGAPLPNTDFCSGFWSELNQRTEKSLSPEAVEISVLDEATENAKNTKNSNPFMKKVLLGEAAVILLLLLYSWGRGALLKNQIKRIEEEKAALETQTEELSERISAFEQNQGNWTVEYEGLEKENASLKDRNAKLEDQNEALRAENEALRNENKVLNENDEDAEESAVSSENSEENGESGASTEGIDGTVEEIQREEPTHPRDWDEQYENHWEDQNGSQHI